MKFLLFISLTFCLVLSLFINSSATCYPVSTTSTVPTTFSVQNKVSNATLKNIKWCDFYVYSELLPGQSSGKYRIYDYQLEKQSTYAGVIKFTLSAKNSDVYLETVDSFTLTKNEQKTFIIDNDTKVKNPLLEKVISKNLYDFLK
ncbi:MAG TPA: hypothetical protein PK771_04755 [Spirochaetota bacterium]|nr:hypothetical protein [Spirochaetota bacterium]